MKKKLLAAVLVGAMAMSMAACGQKQEAAPAPAPEKEEAAEEASEAEEEAAPEVAGAVDPKNGDHYVIGYTYYYVSEFINLMNEGIKAKAEELGVEVIYLDAQKDPQRQLEQVENLIAQDVDCVYVAAVDADGIVPTLDMADEAGVPIVAVNMLYNTDRDYYYSGPDDVLAGYLEAKAAYEGAQVAYPDVECFNLVIAQGPTGTSAMIQRQEGNDKFIDEVGRDSKMHVYDQQPKNWSREEACTYVENAIQAYGVGGTDGLHIVIGHNDEMALGAIEAIEGQGYVPGKDIIVTGVDAIQDGCAAVREGKQYATVYQDAALEGGQGLQICYDILTGNAPAQYMNYIDMTCWTQEGDYPVQDLIDQLYPALN